MSGLVRPARPLERFAVVKLARDFHRAASLPYEFCPAHFSATAQDHIEAPRKLALILEVDGALRGALLASWHVCPLYPHRQAQELLFWVDPAHRGRAPRKMVAAYEEWARAEGCAVAALSGLLTDERLARWFQGAGFTLSENKFQKMLG